MKPQVLFGPYFVATSDLTASHPELEPLGLAIEWATPTNAPRIPLFCRRERPFVLTRLEHILVHVQELPFPIECEESHVVESATGAFVPLESLLVRLYRTHAGTRSVFDLLRDLASRVQIHNAVTRPIPERGLLLSQVETRGFILNTCLPAPSGLLAEIAWKPYENRDPFHVCLCRFARISTLEGDWVGNGMIGLSKLLAQELRQIAPGRPASLFSPLGLEWLSRLDQGVPQPLTG